MNHRTFFLGAALAWAGLTSSNLAVGAGGGFQSGDLYLYNPAFSGLSSSDGAIVRIDPAGGSVSVVIDLVTSSSGSGAMTYDPWRDRLIFFGGLVPNHNELYLSDAAGNLQSLGFGVVSGPTLGRLTSRGDGIIYFTGYNAPGVISYLDPTNQLKTLMDASGTAPYMPGALVNQITRMHYDATTNALFVATGSNVAVCPGGIQDAVSLRRLSLSADGSRVVGETCFQYDVVPNQFGEVPVGITQGPGQELLLTVDDNSNGASARIARVDPSLATATAYAVVGSYLGAAATNAGCYSHVLGRAVILDTFSDVLRAYSAGQGGSGSIIATGVSSSGGSGETATLVEIGSPVPLDGLTADQTSISLSTGGTQTLQIDLGPAFAGSGFLVLGSLSGFNPGVFVGGQYLPLVPDAYFSWTFAHPNTPILQNSFATLDVQGRATTLFVLPPGTPAVYAGITLHHAAVAFAPNYDVQRTTNAVPVTLVP